LIPAEDKTGSRKTLCISSQVGCALDCSRPNFRVNLTKGATHGY